MAHLINYGEHDGIVGGGRSNEALKNRLLLIEIESKKTTRLVFIQEEINFKNKTLNT